MEAQRLPLDVASSCHFLQQPLGVNEFHHMVGLDLKQISTLDYYWNHDS